MKLQPATEGPLTKEQTELQETRSRAFDELREFEDSLGWND